MREKNKKEVGEEKLDGGGKRRGKNAIKMESRLRTRVWKRADLKTNGPVLCVEDISFAAHRRLPRSASASKKEKTRMADTREQKWRESEANGW